MTAPVVCRFPSLVSQSPEVSARIGEALSSCLRQGDLVLCRGTLGAGKTFLASAIGEALGAPSVKSPTFAIERVHRLRGRDCSFVHVDLYRLDEAGDEAMTIEEHLADGDIVLVEWAERWRRPPTSSRIDIAIDMMGDARAFDFAAFGLDTVGRFARAYVEMMKICR